MSEPAPLLVPTEDGSLSCRDEATGELYHNRAGAYAEALINYAEPSHVERMLRPESTFRILDVCFGLGYNSFVTLSRLLALDVKDWKIEIVGIEIDDRILDAVPHIFSYAALSGMSTVILPRWKSGLDHLSADFAGGRTVDLTLKRQDLRTAVPETESQSVDLIFHDPFSPRKVPQFWTQELFNHYARILNPASGKLLTYSVASSVRSALLQAGFKVYRTTALGAKSGGTLATLSPDDIHCSHVFPMPPGERL